MRITWRLVAITLACVLSSEAIAAETSRKDLRSQSSRTRSKTSLKSQSSKSKATDGVQAIVSTDGTIVYDKPDVDSAVLVMLPVGQKIRVSKKTVGDAEKFHRIIIKGRIGFISAIDIQIGDGPLVEGAQSATKSAKAASKKAKKKKEREKPREPIFLSRYVGLVAGSTEFKESINNVDASTSFPIYGLKVTGPGILLDGPIIDANLLLHYGAPSYYERLSSIKPTGFVLFMNANFLLPIAAGDNGMFYAGVGPLLVLSKFSVYNTGRAMDLTSLNLGASFALGAAYRISKVALRLETTFMVEKQSYKAIQFAIQNEF